MIKFDLLMNDQQLIFEGKAKIVKYDTTFYNPAQKTNRDISIALLSRFFHSKESIKILDAMSATGLRGIRYLMEIPTSTVVFNDISDESIRCITENLMNNEFEAPEVIGLCDFNKVVKSTNKAIIVKSDCNSLMCEFKNYFDAIDIDPFGSCSEYIENAMRSIKHNGILCFTSTDKGALCTNEKKCNTKYDTVILKKYSQNELPLRVLVSCISRTAAKLGYSIEPVLSLTLDFYVRIFVKILKRQPKKKITSNKLLFLCQCGNYRETDSVNTGNIHIQENHYIQEIESYIDINNFNKTEQTDHINNCNVCKHKMKLCGPFWTAKLHCKQLIADIISNCNIDRRMSGIFNYVEQELEELWYYEISRICKMLKLCCIKLKDMCTALKNLGYEISLTHCEINGFKTTAPLKIVRAIIKMKNDGIETKIFERNMFVETLFATNFNKGMIKSGLGPLSLPK